MSTFRLIAAMLLALSLAGCSRSAAQRVEWTTMGTLAAVQVRAVSSVSLAACRDAVRDAFASIEARLNAHDTTSELRRLAAFDEDRIIEQCSQEVRPCYEAAFRLRRLSDGAFNPRWRGPTTLDLGAIAKGFALDAAAVRAEALSPDEILLDLGGNLKCVRGTWTVGIAGSDTVLTLTNGMACATSAEYFRGKHIYDGRTGLAVSNGVKSVTVIHPTSATLADGLSTALFILGQEKGEAFLRAHHPEARAVWIL